jgi:hypothetical protein
MILCVHPLFQNYFYQKNTPLILCGHFVYFLFCMQVWTRLRIGRSVVIPVKHKSKEKVRDGFTWRTGVLSPGFYDSNMNVGRSR